MQVLIILKKIKLCWKQWTGIDIWQAHARQSPKFLIFNNIQLIHGQGFNDDERADLVPFVHKNIFDAMDTFISQMASFDVSFSDPLREEDVVYIQNEDEVLEKRLSAAR